jgi:hypothetical protein
VCASIYFDAIKAAVSVAFGTADHYHPMVKT